MEAKAKQYGLNMEVEADRLKAAEEVLAEMAQTNPQSSFVQRAIAAIRTWLRENVLCFEEMGLTDDEIINNYLIPAREFVQRGARAQGSMAPAFNRASGIHKTNAAVNRQIEQWAKGKLPRDETLQLGNPSEILRLFNVPDLPIRLTQYTLTKARKKHELTAADLKDIALNVQTPIAAFKSTHGEGHIVLVTEARHAKGNVT